MQKMKIPNLDKVLTPATEAYYSNSSHYSKIKRSNQ